MYGWDGRSKMSRTGPLSTTRPAYITITRSHIFATMPKSCVMKISARFVSSWISRSRRKYWAWMVTSSEVVGSSAMMTCGSQEIAIAPTTRCFMPPLIWWG